LKTYGFLFNPLIYFYYFKGVLFPEAIGKLAFAQARIESGSKLFITGAVFINRAH